MKARWLTATALSLALLTAFVLPNAPLLALSSPSSPQAEPVCGVGAFEVAYTMDPSWVILWDVDMASAADGWAVGSAEAMLHYTAGSWSVVDFSPDGLTDWHGVSALAPNDVWAVGFYWTETPPRIVQIKHYDGTAWKWYSTAQDGRLEKVAMASATRGWAVGADGSGQGLLMAWDGANWARVSAPDAKALRAVSSVPGSTTEAWAGGDDATLLHLSGGSWQPVPIAGLPADKDVSSIAMLSASRGWAGTSAGLFEYNGTAWARVAEVPATVGIGAISLTSATDGWAVGSGLWHYNGRLWQSVSSPSLADLDTLSDSAGWAVSQGRVWRYNPSLVTVRCISGRVTQPNGTPATGVTVSDGAGHTATTDAQGYYTLSGMPSGTYAVRPTSTAAWVFQPRSRQVPVSSYTRNVDFTAIARHGDDDGDALLNGWELEGYDDNGDGVIDVALPTLGADPIHKDIFVEVDYMVEMANPAAGVAVGRSFRPKEEAISNVVNAFEDSPVPNPDGIPGIKLHVEIDEPLAYSAEIQAPGTVWNWTGFDHIKVAQGHFNPAKRRVYHYVIAGSDLGADVDPGTSGYSRNLDTSDADFRQRVADFAMTLGQWSGDVGTVLEQGGTFMHELGHNLGLRHGGDDHDNYEPNYLSIMSYSFQTPGLIYDNAFGKLDYSRFAGIPALDENHLNETQGIQGGYDTARYGTSYRCLWNGAWQSTWNLEANGPIDWDCQGGAVSTNIAADINHDLEGPAAPTYSVLRGADDWSMIVYGGGAVGVTASGAEQSEIEETTSPSAPDWLREITYDEDLKVARPYRIVLEGSAEIVASFGASTTRAVTVRNRGPAAATVLLGKSCPAGWFDCASLPASVTLQPNGSASYPVRVTSPTSRSGATSARAKLTATVPGQPLQTDVAVLDVRLGPLARFEGEPASTTRPLTLGFTDWSVGSIISWSWDFGDGATSSQRHPTHTYARAGTYTIRLTVAGPDGSDTVSQTRVLQGSNTSWLYLPQVWH